jgi:hypothetical protein
MVLITSELTGCEDMTGQPQPGRGSACNRAELILHAPVSKAPNDSRAGLTPDQWAESTSSVDE